MCAYTTTVFLVGEVPNLAKITGGNGKPGFSSPKSNC